MQGLYCALSLAESYKVLAEASLSRDRHLVMTKIPGHFAGPGQEPELAKIPNPGQEIPAAETPGRSLVSTLITKFLLLSGCFSALNPFC